MAQESPPANSRFRDLAPLLPIVPGLVLLISLATLIHGPVHIAGDGALKHYLLRQWAETGSIESDVTWMPPAPWVEDLWRQFHYPFEAPFVYDGKIVFPPFFLLLSFPLYQGFGYAGLFVLPCLSVLGLWGVIAWLLRRSDVTGLPAALAMTILVLSPLTYFGMMFWEHTPGLFALFGGYALLTRREAKPAADVAGGILLALAVMFRPELVVAAAVMFLFSLARTPRHVGSIPGVAFGLLIWTTVNAWVTGSPIGIHARQPLFLSGGDAIPKLIAYYTEIGAALSTGAAAAIGGIVIGAVLLLRDREGEASESSRSLVVSVMATLLVLPLMIPYSGEYLGFRRFELLLIPAGALMAGRLASRYRWALIVLALLCVSQAPGFVRQYATFRWANGARLATVIKAIETEAPTAIVADSQFTAIELSSQMNGIPLVWAPPPVELMSLIGAVSQRADLDRVALVFWNPGPSPSLTIPVEGHGRVQWIRLAGDDEGFALFMPQ